MKKIKSDQQFLTEEILAETAKRYAKMSPPKEKAEETANLVSFQLSGEWYGIDMTMTEEIVRVPQVASVPHSSADVLGVFNYHSSLVLLVDLRVLFGVTVKKQTETSRIVLVRRKDELTGILADGVSDVVSVARAAFQPAISTIRGMNAEFIRGVAKHRGKHLVWLDAVRILTEFENRISAAEAV